MGGATPPRSPLISPNAAVEVLYDGRDRGPAELQTTEHEETMYEAVGHLGASTNVTNDNANLAAAATVNAVRDFVLMTLTPLWETMARGMN
ncbi:hypothetical protein THAOC_01973 [Thalassiosira oceanica]|uniref:Uncharacterized protein n=1 Tax=Thalassiosira oceanica TaxID=159749 RepID=K0TGY7_THAOC|nr:hypothetical protein THAOC_01973 [Thalassiosira oceanica]|eukprot:EJK76274.1 hypothetical protein THAOC_01973 [Thalassiosira oceanica]